MIRKICRSTSLIICLIISHTLHAEIITDGSLGTASNLAGPDFAITPDLGQQRGSNLLHSFSHFNLSSTETANFTAGNNVSQIIARVTGGDISNINGTINSPNAGLWLLNPAGWLFGANAQINVNGVFHVSTSDSVRFQDGNHFFADLNANSVLTISQPIGVSFQQANNASITIDQSLLVLADQTQFSILANQVTLNDAKISNPGGQILLAATASAGDWLIDSNGISTGNTADLGTISIHNNQFSATNETLSISDIQNGVVSGGRIQLVAKNTLITNAVISSRNFSDQTGGTIELFNTDTLDISKSVIRSENFDKGNAGSIQINADNVILQAGASLNASGSLFSQGKTGNISITASDTFRINGNGSGIFSLSSGEGSGGGIDISAPKLIMSDLAVISTSTTGISNASNINISSQQINLQTGATIDSSSLSDPAIQIGGQGGIISLNTDSLRLQGDTTLITSSSFGSGGKGGDVFINTQDLSLFDLAEIRAESRSASDAGNIIIENKKGFKINNAKITTEAAIADGGQIQISSQDLLLDNALITTSVEGAQGSGGNISIGTDILLMNTGFIQANTNAVGGQGGNINVDVNNLIASQGRVDVGGNQRLNFIANSGRNVIQAAAPDGVAGNVSISSTELDITGDIQTLKAEHILPKTVSNNPCQVKRGQQRSSLVSIGKGGLPLNGNDTILSPVSAPEDSNIKLITPDINSELKSSDCFL